MINIQRNCMEIFHKSCQTFYLLAYFPLFWTLSSCLKLPTPEMKRAKRVFLKSWHPLLKWQASQLFFGNWLDILGVEERGSVLTLGRTLLWALTVFSTPLYLSSNALLFHSVFLGYFWLEVESWWLTLNWCKVLEERTAPSFLLLNQGHWNFKAKKQILTNSSQFAQEFLSISTERPISLHTLQLWANWDNWSPWCWPVFTP